MPASSMAKTLAKPIALGLVLLAASVPGFAATKVNKPAPDFTLKMKTGGNFRLAEHRGEVLFINFWASWCGPCRQEMPILDELHSRYRSAGFNVVGITIDEDPRKADAMLKKIPVTFPVLYDAESSVSELFDVDAMPTSILVDRSGKVRYLHRGYKPGYEVDYRNQIRELIKE